MSKLTAEQRKRIGQDDQFIEDFLGILAENQGGRLIADLIEVADFEANRHSVHDGNGCPNDPEVGTGRTLCDDCYSDDTEHAFESKCKRLLAKVWDEAYGLWKQSNGSRAIDSSDEGSDEAIEMDDEDDLKEEQDEEGNYVRKSVVSASTA